MALIFGTATGVCAGQEAIASTQSHGVSISFIEARKGQYCALLSQAMSGEPLQAANVSMEFTQQVGRIAGRPVSFSPSEETAGLYCADVDLGKQYYQPSYYYVRVYYADSSGKRRAARFYLTMK
jgi:hypothetical protein